MIPVCFACFAIGFHFGGEERYAQITNYGGVMAKPTTAELQKTEEELKLLLDKYVEICVELDLDSITQIEALVEEYLVTL